MKSTPPTPGERVRHALAISAFSLSLMSIPALAEECAPSKWGAEDSIGSANLVTQERVTSAMALVKEGRVQPLGVVIDDKFPAFGPRRVQVTVVQPNQQGGKRMDHFGFPASSNDDMGYVWFGVGSQIDGLGHAGEDGMFYNCNDLRDFGKFTGVTALGTQDIPPLVGRGVVLDMASHFGMDHLPAGHAINAGDLEAAADAQGIEIREGDVALIHTGWIDAKLESAPGEWAKGEPGITEDAAEWLAARNVMAVGADTWGVDVIPPPEGGKVFISHIVLLKRNGIYLLEAMNTGPLVEAGVNEFAFVLGQARIRGTVQMIVNPVAMW